MRGRKENRRVLQIEAAIIIILVCGLLWALPGKTQGSKSESLQNKTEGILKNSKTAGREDSEIVQQAKKIYKENKDLLLLVNKSNAVPEDYDGDLISICDGRLSASEKLYKPLKKMLADGEENGYTFYIASAYRSKERQQELIDINVQSLVNQGMSYDKALKETLKEQMPAGYSEHQTGLALDILSSKNLTMDVTQEQDEGNQWLRKHCAEYGFILRYPAEKEEITRISYEPWHFRYVGKKAAKFMEKYRLSLEEFMEMVRK